jgi:hypothetical protein
MSPPEMVDVLLDAGADPASVYDGITPYAYARILGNTVLILGYGLGKLSVT